MLCAFPRLWEGSVGETPPSYPDAERRPTWPLGKLGMIIKDKNNVVGDLPDLKISKCILTG